MQQKGMRKSDEATASKGRDEKQRKGTRESNEATGSEGNRNKRRNRMRAKGLLSRRGEARYPAVTSIYKHVTL